MSSSSRWEKLLWPRWMPVTYRMPVIAQITGAVAVTALVMGPWWARVATRQPVPARTLSTPVALAAPVTRVAPVAAAAPVTPGSERPAHLNLDVRHSFRTVDLSVTVDGKRVLDTKLEGNGKRFGLVGKRAARSFTQTLDLQPGVRVVRVRVKSADEKFDQTRTERFELDSASVGALRVIADKSGLSLSADRPQIKAVERASQVTTVPVVAAAPPPAAPVPTAASVQSDAMAELLQTVRSMLIAMAGFVASAATGFVVQEYLRSHRRRVRDSSVAIEP